jgi:phosphoglucosamine mutase
LSAGIARVEKRLGKSGRLLVRWSGTEPKLRVMAEGPDEKVLRQLVAELISLAKKDASGRS